MVFSHRLIAVTVALLPAVAMAEQLQATVDPVSANATVPTVQYQSSFASYRSAADEEATPDAHWISANQEVAGGGHSMHGMHNMNTPGSSTMQMNMHDGHAGHQMGSN
jgi:hypothetical protein